MNTIPYLFLAIILCFQSVLVIQSCGDTMECENCDLEDLRSQDSLILVELYNSLDGENWNQSWNLNTPMDQWFGISLNAKGLVSKIELQGNGHSGRLPDNISQLIELTALEIRSGVISDDIPPDLNNLTKLQFLRLDDNGLTGTIPEEIGEITSLEVIDLAQNNLEGSIPKELGNLLALDFLDLANNQLSGEIPPELGNLTNLKFIICRANDLSGCIPSQLNALCSLIGFDLSSNPLLPWEGETTNFCSNLSQIGAPCQRDGLPASIDTDCNCLQ